MKKNIILFVQNIPSGTIESIRKYEKKVGKKFRIAIIGDKKAKENEDADIFIVSDFSNSESVMKSLKPYRDEIVALTCRMESRMDLFSKVVPNLPYVKTPTTQSIEWSLDKTSMRKRFYAEDKKITPKYMLVGDATKKTVKEIKDKIGFPLVLKPAGLAQSILVNICYHKEELESNLKKTIKTINKIYRDWGRENFQPQILVEQFMEGDLYSVDVYVNSKGKIYFCPMVYTKTGKNVGFDDFFGYQQMTPTILKKENIEKAQEVASKAIKAVALRSSTAHIELMRTEDGWKVVEIGPRVGGFRHKLYQMSYGIDHAMNDILIRMAKTPILPKKVLGYSAAFKFYAKEEGILKEFKGVKKIRDIKSVKDIDVRKKVGDRCVSAKNGGKSVCNVILFNKDRSELLADIRRMEKTIVIKTSKRRNS